MSVAVADVVRRTFTDPDELEETLNLRRQVRVIQLSPQPFICNMLRLDLGLAEFLFISLNTSIRILGDKTSGWLDFDFVMPPTPGDLISHGLPVRHDTVFGFDNAREINMVLPGNLMLGALQVKREVFEDYLPITLRSDLDDRFFARNYVQSPTHFTAVQQYLNELYGLVTQRSPFLKQPQISRLLLDDYLPLLIDSIPCQHQLINSGDLRRTRIQLVRQAEDYMLANLGQMLTLKTLCDALNTTKTPLNYGFQEVLGVSPMVYLKLLRLRAIHKVLKNADPGSKIVNLAHQFGFWHMGRFSQEYHQMFGQLPSATLQQ